MSRIELLVSFLAGTDIVDAIKDARRLARILDVAYIKFDFNGISVAVSQDPDILEMKKGFNKALKKENLSFVCG